MGHCVHIYFESKSEKDAAFFDLATSSDTEIIAIDTIRVIDPSSNSDNFITNGTDFIKVDIDVKTRPLSIFMVNKLGRYQCRVKDCDDSEEEPSEHLTNFFRC